MKIIKLCALVLTAAMLLSLVTACSTNNGPAESPAEESSTVPADASTVSEDASAVSEDAFGTDSSTEAPERVEFEGNARVNVNKFLTVFAKQCFYAAPSAGKFDAATATAEDLAKFAFFNIKLNSYRDFEHKNKGDVYYATFSVDKASGIVSGYMSCLLKEDDCKALPAPSDTFEGGSFGPFYEDGRLWFIAGDGERYTDIAVVDYADNTGDGTLTMYFSIYSIDYEIFDDLDEAGLERYYSLSCEEADNDSTLTKLRKGVANVSVGQNGYYLNTYEVNIE